MPRYLVYLAQKVAGHDHRHAEALGKLQYQLAHLLYPGRVKAVRRLVKDQQLRIAQQRPARPRRCFMPSEVGRALVLLSVQPHYAQHLVHVLLRRALHLPYDLKVFLPRQVSVVAGRFDKASVRRRISRLFAAFISFPNSFTAPDVGCTRPSAIFSVVDFPAPFGPRKPYMLPSGTERFSPLTRIAVPYLLHNERVSSIAICNSSPFFLVLCAYYAPCLTRR